MYVADSPREPRKKIAIPSMSEDRRFFCEDSSVKNIVVVTEGLEPSPLDWLRKQVEVVECSWKNTSGLKEKLAGADGLIVRTYTRVDEKLLSMAPRLKVVGRAGVGLDNIDLAACARRSVRVVSTPDANTHAVCEYVFNLAGHLGRPLVTLQSPIPADEFHFYRKTIRGLELHGQTLGILGMGRIGRAVGRVGVAFGMNVLYNDLVDVAAYVDFPARSVSKDELYGQADILTIHVSHIPGNRHLLNRSTLALLRPSTILINTARGEVIDAYALAEALKGGKLAAAAIDVHDPEPPGPDYPLWGLANVILTPHLAARTRGAMEAMSWVVRDVVQFLSR